MKHRFKKILAAVLSASLCVPTLPTAAVQAAEANDAAIVWTDAETISATQISEEERVINFNEEWKFYLGDSTTAQILTAPTKTPMSMSMVQKLENTTMGILRLPLISVNICPATALQKMLLL